MSRVTAFSSIVLSNFLTNPDNYTAFLSALSNYRLEHLKGNLPAIPQFVQPEYTSKGELYRDKGIAELKAELNALNQHPHLKRNGLIFSFESTMFAWGYTPVELRHLSCGTISFYRAYGIQRLISADNFEQLSCCKRECYEHLTGITLGANSATPSRKGSKAGNALSEDSVMRDIENQSNGVLELVKGSYTTATAPLVARVSAPGKEADGLFVVFRSHTNCMNKKTYEKAASRIQKSGKVHGRTQSFPQYEQARDYISTNFGISL